MNKRIRKKLNKLKMANVVSWKHYKKWRRFQHEQTIKARHIGYAIASVSNYWEKTLQFKRRINIGD